MLGHGTLPSLQKKIVLVMADYLEKGDITEAQMSEIAEFVLDVSDSIQSDESLILFLEELAQRWKIFRDLYLIEAGRVKDSLDQKRIQEALELTKNGKIEEALQVTKGTTY